MAELQPIETAPKNEQVIMSFWDNLPVMIAWSNAEPKITQNVTGVWPFRKRETITEERTGWRVLIFIRDWGYGIHGNFPPFNPTHWMPLPAPPSETPTDGE